VSVTSATPCQLVFVLSAVPSGSGGEAVRAVERIAHHAPAGVRGDDHRELRGGLRHLDTLPALEPRLICDRPSGRALATAAAARSTTAAPEAAASAATAAEPAAMAPFAAIMIAAFGGDVLDQPRAGKVRMGALRGKPNGAHQGHEHQGACCSHMEV